MHKLIISILLLSLLAIGCSEDETAIQMCECEPDEYCAGDECIKTSEGNIAPAPDED